MRLQINPTSSTVGLFIFTSSQRACEERKFLEATTFFGEDDNKYTIVWEISIHHFGYANELSPSEV